ncbi:unnamed protein product [Laminaria digitata]
MGSEFSRSRACRRCGRCSSRATAPPRCLTSSPFGIDGSDDAFWPTTRSSCRRPTATYLPAPPHPFGESIDAFYDRAIEVAHFEKKGF